MNIEEEGVVSTTRATSAQQIQPLPEPAAAEGSESLGAVDCAEATRSADPASAAPIRELVAARGPTPVRDPGRYEILGEHGRGGLGRVSRAHDKDFGRDIAIKELLSRGHVNELRFVREAMITARLEHPGIVPVYEAGRWPDGTPFYAMKLVSGRSLRALIAERTTVDARIELLHHVIAVADAIAYAHGRSIIHRDLKPANVIVGDFGETVVIDWGLAKDLSESGDLPRGDGSPRESDDGLTSAGSILGTPTYMAPEQERGESVDQRADVFAIGAMLWELCAVQKVPPADLAQRHRMLRRAGIDSDLVTIIDKSLEPDPERRYLDAGALAADLKAFKSGARIAARDYTLWAMLVHWTRRHRALALSITAALVFVVTGTIVFVRNIALERDRADTALISAQQERDRSKLSEASLVLDADPNRANDLLASFTTRTPQLALLTGRARQRSATQIVKTSSTIEAMYRAPGEQTVELWLGGGELGRMDPRTGELTVVNPDVVMQPFVFAGQSLQVRRRLAGRGVQLLTSSSSKPVEAGNGSSVQLVALNGTKYLLDRLGELHRIDDGTSSVVDHGVHAISGAGDVLLVCRRNGELDVQRAGVAVLRRRCRKSKSHDAVAVIGGDYATLTADGVLLTERGGQVLEIPTRVSGEYELALSSQGVVAIADYAAGGTTWLLPPGSTSLEPGPAYSSHPFSVAADGNLAAWGYVDGTVIVRDAVTGSGWELRGHHDEVQRIVIDASHGRVVSATQRELRAWDIKPMTTAFVAAMPCSNFHIESSPDGGDAALDCDDGGVRVWSRQTGAVTQIHKHDAYSFGLGWMRGMICSGGWGDGRVHCSSLDGKTTKVLDTGSRKINSLAVSPDRTALIVVASDGNVWRFDGRLQRLYAHGGPAEHAAISADGHLLASCARDGSLAVFDLMRERLIASRFAHVGAHCRVAWVEDELWSSGDEGTLKRWTVLQGDLTLRHMVQASAALRHVKAFGRGWVGIEGKSGLLVSHDGTSVTLRIDAGQSVTALDVSPGDRYVAASIDGELLVIDMQRNAIATLPIGTVRQLRFLEPALIAFSEPAALKTLRVDELAYTPFELTPEPPNRASF